MVFKIKIFAFIFFAILSKSWSQNTTQLDSLKRVLNQPMADTSKVLLLEQIALKVMYSKPSIALQYTNEGLELANKIKFLKGKSRILNRLGTIYRLTSNYGASLKAHLEALQISEELNDQEGLCKIYNNIGNLYLEQRNYKSALEYEKKANLIAYKLNNIDLIESTLINIANDFEADSQLDSASFYLQKSFQIAQKNNDSKYLYFTLSNLGRINYKQGNFDLAMNYYRKVVPYFKKEGNINSLSENYFNIAKIFELRNKPDSCLAYAQKSLELARDSQNYDIIFKSSNLLSQLYEKTDLRKSIDFYKLGISAKDSIFNIEKSNQMQNVAVQEQVRRIELSNEKKDFENRQRTSLLIGLLAVFLLITSIQFRNNRQKNEANKILNKQKIEIESQKTQIESSLERLKITQKQLIQQEKLASLGELTAGIAHEIQNPLNFVNNFSEVNIELIKEIQDERTKTLTERDEALEKELLSDLLNNQDKIYHHGKRASGIVKAMLDHSRNSTGQRTKIEINPLVEEYLKLSFLGLRAKYPNFSADYQLDVDPNVPLIEVVSQDIGRVLLNLMNNAFYAVMDRKIEMDKANIEYSPKVIVNTKFNPNEDLNGHLGYVEIRVEDNGNGVNEAIKDKILQPFFTTKPTGEGTGLGLSLSYEIITKGHNGTLAIESTEGEGATFVIKLPIQ